MFTDQTESRFSPQSKNVSMQYDSTTDNSQASFTSHSTSNDSNSGGLKVTFDIFVNDDSFGNVQISRSSSAAKKSRLDTSMNTYDVGNYEKQTRDREYISNENQSMDYQESYVPHEDLSRKLNTTREEFRQSNFSWKKKLMHEFYREKNITSQKESEQKYRFEWEFSNLNSEMAEKAYTEEDKEGAFALYKLYNQNIYDQHSATLHHQTVSAYSPSCGNDNNSLQSFSDSLSPASFFSFDSNSSKNISQNLENNFSSESSSSSGFSSCEFFPRLEKDLFSVSTFNCEFSSDSDSSESISQETENDLPLESFSSSVIGNNKSNLQNVETDLPLDLSFRQGFTNSKGTSKFVENNFCLEPYTLDLNITKSNLQNLENIFPSKSSSRLDFISSESALKNVENNYSSDPCTLDLNNSKNTLRSLENKLPSESSSKLKSTSIKCTTKIVKSNFPSEFLSPDWSNGKNTLRSLENKLPSKSPSRLKSTSSKSTPKIVENNFLSESLSLKLSNSKTTLQKLESDLSKSLAGFESTSTKRTPKILEEMPNLDLNSSKTTLQNSESTLPLESSSSFEFTTNKKLQLILENNFSSESPTNSGPINNKSTSQNLENNPLSESAPEDSENDSLTILSDDSDREEKKSTERKTRKPRGRQYSPKQKEKIIAQYRDTDISLRGLSRESGISFQTLRKWTSELETKYKRRKYTDEEREEALKFYVEENYTVEETARKLGIPWVTLNYWITKKNLKKPYKYTKEEKERVLNIYYEGKMSKAELARELKIPRSTLKQWVHEKDYWKDEIKPVRTHLRHTAEERERVLEIYREGNMTQVEVARKLKIPRATVQVWINKQKKSKA